MQQNTKDQEWFDSSIPTQQPVSGNIGETSIQITHEPHKSEETSFFPEDNITATIAKSVTFENTVI